MNEDLQHTESNLLHGASGTTRGNFDNDDTEEISVEVVTPEEENEVETEADSDTEAETDDMAGRFHPPGALDFTNPSAWPQWKKRYERYTIVAKLNKEEKDMQVSTLINCMGPDTEQIFFTFHFADPNDAKDPKIVMERFDGHFIPKRNTISENSTNDNKKLVKR
jgi:hypothetical protein